MDFSRLFEGDLLRERARMALATIHEKHPRAKDTGEDHCCRSGMCCWVRPGVLNAEDVGRIAEHLGLTPQQLFSQYLVVDRIKGRLGLLPRRRHQADLAGSMIDWRETYSAETPCVWLGDGNACTVHPVKPSQCRGYECWSGKESGMPEWTEAELEALGWDGVDPDEWDDDESDY